MAPAADAPPLRGRQLGGSRHPVAAGCNAVGITIVDGSEGVQTLKLATYSPVGTYRNTTTVAVADTDYPAPALAAFPDETFALAWTDFESDGDELGVRLAKINPAAPTQAPPSFANSSTAFSQRAPDVVFDGNQLIVAWVDDSDPVNGPDLRYRTFGTDLVPTDEEQTLAATDAVEDHVSLAAANGAWAAAWRSGRNGLETIEVQSGAVRWSVGPFLQGPAGDIPALEFIDATHLAVAFTKVDSLDGDPHTPRLHAAILDAAFPGAVQSFALKPLVAPYSIDDTLSQTQPSLEVFRDRLFVGWRSEAVPGAANGEELWKREVSWAFDGRGTLNIDASALEVPLVPPAQRAGDQATPILMSSPFWPEHRTFIAWDDAGRTFGARSGVRDVGVQVTSIPKATCAASSLVTNPSGGPIVSSSVVGLTATAACPSGSSASYRFAYAPANTTNYVYIGDWSASASSSWNTTGLIAGDYDVVVLVRESTTTTSYESMMKKTLTISGPPPCSISLVNTAPGGPVPVGTSVAVSATGSCPSGATAHYRFASAPANTTDFTYLGNWGVSSTATWNTASLAQANYDIVAFVRPSTSAGAAEGSSKKVVSVRSKCTNGSLATSPATGGSLVTLTGSATCSDPQFSYFYTRDNDTSTWTPIGSAWVLGSVSLNTTTVTPGSYLLKVDVRELGFGTGDTSATIHRQLGPGCGFVQVFNEAGGHPQGLGSLIEVYSEATCDPGVTPEYSFFYKRPEATEWTQFPGTDWQPYATGVLDTTEFVGQGLGFINYDLRVLVRGFGHVGFFEASGMGSVSIDD